MSFKIKVNTPILLTLQLHDGAENKYPQAVIRDSAGNTILGSPVDLPHIGNGLYRDLTKSLASPQIISVTFITYDDASHTVESNDHQRATVDYEIIQETTSIDTPVFTTGEKELVGVIPGQVKVIGEIETATLNGIIRETELFSNVTPEEVQGVLNSEAIILGEVRCE